ncbi:hypothetical protein N1851_005090 [Merluccius polli]|uniref:YqaJ viral recombinase domain-containing protein n=1 Tax=Merluccius polli TaxID=89951 RepID=A0AA47N6A8_MERPO|nr:hypothetical protein N1851_005090 [Merluccius polli]
MAGLNRSLQDVPRLTVNDVHRIVQATSKTPTAKKDKGFKLYVSSYIHNYEALLYQTAHYSQLGLTSVPPVFSCTETEQKWHKPRTMGIKPGPVNDMVIISARPRERRLAEGIRSNLYKGVSCPLPDISTLKVQEAYHGLRSDEAPMITAMAVSSDVPLVESMFGPVQEGSVLSYQLPLRTVPSSCPHTDAPSPPQLPLSYYRLGPSTCPFVFSEHQHHHMASLAISLETAHKIEKSTREQSSCVEWHQLRRCRITSTKFREVCHTRGESSAENLAKRLLGSSHQTADMRRGLALEPIAVEEYCKSAVGFVGGKNLTLEERGRWALTPQLSAVKDDCGVRVVLKVCRQISPYLVFGYPDPHRAEYCKQEIAPEPDVLVRGCKTMNTEPLPQCKTLDL